MSNMISCVFITYNEAHIIEKSILAVQKHVSEIIVMDMYSCDGTAQIAKNLGATVFSIEKVWNFGIARTYGIEKSKYDWILLLDADEIVSEGLMAEILNSVSENKAELFYLPRANFAFSGFAPNESNFPEFQPRFFNKKFMALDKYNGELHLHYEPLAHARKHYIAGHFPQVALYHITNPTVTSFMNKINNYTSIETKERLNKGIHFSIVKAIKSPLVEFIRHFIFNKGFKDGWRGFWLSISFLIYELQIHAKLWEASLYNHQQPSDAIAREKMLTLFSKEKRN